MTTFKPESNVDWNLDQVTGHMNSLKDQVIYALGREGYITPEQAQEAARTIGVVVERKGWFGILMTSVFGQPETDTGFRMTIIRRVDVMGELEEVVQQETEEDEKAENEQKIETLQELPKPVSQIDIKNSRFKDL